MTVRCEPGIDFFDLQRINLRNASLAKKELVVLDRTDFRKITDA